MKKLALLVLFALPASAQVTYSYTGAPMSGTLTGGASQWDFTQIGGTVILAQALNPNQANQIVVPLSFNFGGTALDSGVADAASFSFTTQNGVITSWNVVLEFHPGGPAQVNLTLATAGDQYLFSNYPPTCFHESVQIAGCTQWQAQNAIAGSWADPPSQAQVTALQTQLATVEAQTTSLQAQLTKAQASSAYYFTDANGYLDDLLASHQQTAVWVNRAKTVAKKCGCSW